jgi:hypothetical protein
MSRRQVRLINGSPSKRAPRATLNKYTPVFVLPHLPSEIDTALAPQTLLHFRFLLLTHTYLTVAQYLITQHRNTLVVNNVRPSCQRDGPSLTHPRLQQNSPRRQRLHHRSRNRRSH